MPIEISKNDWISKFVFSKRQSVAESQTFSNEYISNKVWSKRSSVSTLYNETTSFKQKTKARIAASIASKSQSSAFSGSVPPSSKIILILNWIEINSKNKASRPITSLNKMVYVSNKGSQVYMKPKVWKFKNSGKLYK